MKDLFQNQGHECDIFRDKSVKSRVIDVDFFNPYEIICLGSCTHAMSPAMVFKSFLKKIPKEGQQNKKLVCFATCGAKSEKIWNRVCNKIKDKVPQFDHIGNIGCRERDNEAAVKNLEEIVKKI